MAVRYCGMREVFVTLVRTKKDCCMVKPLIVLLQRSEDG